MRCHRTFSRNTDVKIEARDGDESQGIAGVDDATTLQQRLPFSMTSRKKSSTVNLRSKDRSRGDEDPVEGTEKRHSEKYSSVVCDCMFMVATHFRFDQQ